MQTHLGSTTTKTKNIRTGGETIMEGIKLEKNKITHTGCDHPDSLHDEGLCWKVTNPELEGEQNNKKYCPCASNKGLIRRFGKVGYMEPEAHDQMVTKKCDVCGIEGLFNVDNSICLSCKAFYKYNTN